MAVEKKKKKKNEFIIHKKHDTILKYLIGKHPKEFLKILKIRDEFVGLKPTENVDLLQQTFELDSLIETKENLHNIEFQSNKLTPEKKRFIAIYSILSYGKHGKPVQTHTVNLEDVVEGIVEEEVAPNVKFKYRNISLFSIPGNEILNNIEVKVLNNEELTGYEILIMKLIAYTQKDNKELFKRSCEIADKLEYDDKLREEIKRVQNYFNKNIIKNGEEWEEINMIITGHVSLEQRVAERLMNEGREEGEKKGKKEVATNLKKGGMNNKQIQKATGLTKEEIEKL